MPVRAATACGTPLCPNTRPCPQHPASWTEGQRGRIMPPGWSATRTRILARDHHWCRSCCASPATEVHHLRPGTEGDEWLVSLCSPCHRRATQAQSAAARGALSATLSVVPTPTPTRAATESLASPGAAPRREGGTRRRATALRSLPCGSSGGGEPPRAAEPLSVSRPAARAAGFPGFAGAGSPRQPEGRTAARRQGGGGAA